MGEGSEAGAAAAAAAVSTAQERLARGGGSHASAVGRGVVAAVVRGALVVVDGVGVAGPGGTGVGPGMVLLLAIGPEGLVVLAWLGRELALGWEAGVVAVLALEVVLA